MARTNRAINSALASDKSDTCEPGARNALPSWPKKYAMPGEKSRRASVACEKIEVLRGHW
jgi:hypothetical protein